MSVASHLGIQIRDYDKSIRQFIPHYEEMLTEAAAALRRLPRRAPALLELGIGSGALAARSLAVTPRARVIGIDADAAILALARKRLGPRASTVVGDFASIDLPRCDAIISSFALHHVRTRVRKAALYRRCFKVIKRGGLLISADCTPASDRRQRALDRAAWRTHLTRTWSRARAEGFLRAWAREDVYVPLEDEMALLEGAGFRVDVAWRRGAFAVIVGRK